jgi:hypothetical protein
VWDFQNSTAILKPSPAAALDISGESSKCSQKPDLSTSEKMAVHLLTQQDPRGTATRIWEEVIRIEADH